MLLSLPTAKLANPKVQAGAFDASRSLALKRLDLSNDAGKVQFVNSELALKAVEELNGRELLGREAPVERQTERERERNDIFCRSTYETQQPRTAIPVGILSTTPQGVP